MTGMGHGTNGFDGIVQCVANPCEAVRSHANNDVANLIEQELLDQICDIIVRMGAYRFAWIGYALHDAVKSVRPMAHAGHEAGYLAQIVATWSEEPSGKGPTGTAIRE